MNFKLIAWFAGMCLVGNFVYSIFGTQISIINRCSRKLFDMIKNDHEYWFSDSCGKYLKSVVRKNRIIIIAISAVVILFVPKIGVLGYLIGLILAWIIGGKRTGINHENIEDTIAIFARFARPGMEEEFKEGISWVAQKLENESMFKAF